MTDGWCWSWLLLLWSPVLLAQPAIPADTGLLVVAPGAALPTLEPLLAQRRAEGLGVASWPLESLPSLTPERLRAALHGAWTGTGGELRYVLLVGDVVAEPDGLPAIPWWTYDGFGSDFPYAELTGDLVPELAVGRLPVRTLGQLRDWVARLLALSREEPGSWQRRVILYGGPAGFGDAADAIMSSLVRRLLTQTLPAHVRVSITLAMPGTDASLPAGQLADALVGDLGDRPLVAMLVGRGTLDGLEPVAGHAILDRRVVTSGFPDCGRTIVLVLASDTARLDGDSPSLAETWCRTANGPVAYVGSSAASTVIQNAYCGEAFASALLEGPDARLGDAYRLAQQRLARAEPGRDPGYQQMVGGLAVLLAMDADDERLFNLFGYQLLGDPSQPLRRPVVDLPIEAEWTPTGRLRVTIQPPGAMSCRLLLERERPADPNAGPAARRLQAQRQPTWMSELASRGAQPVSLELDGGAEPGPAWLIVEGAWEGRWHVGVTALPER